MDDERSVSTNEVSAAAERPPAGSKAAKKSAKKATKAATKTASKARAKTASKAPAKAPNTSAKTRSAAAKRRTLAAADVVESKTPVTEKPVPLTPPPKTSQYLVTVDNFTGAPTKIERVNDQTGDKQELSRGEYASLAATVGHPLTTPVSPRAFAVTNVSGAPEDFFQGSPSDDPALTEAYYRGVVDYLHALGLA
jgi:hypothetical protein